MQQRQFLEDCDFIFKSIQNIGQRADVTQDMISKIRFPLKKVINYLTERGHIKTWGTSNIHIQEDGETFHRQTSYVQEYDKLYEKISQENTIRNNTVKEIPKVISNRRWTIFWLALSAIAGTIIMLCTLKCKV